MLIQFDFFIITYSFYNDYLANQWMKSISDIVMSQLSVNKHDVISASIFSYLEKGMPKWKLYISRCKKCFSVTSFISLDMATCNSFNNIRIKYQWIIYCTLWQAFIILMFILRETIFSKCVTGTLNMLMFTHWHLGSQHLHEADTFLQKTLPVQSTFILHLHTFSFFAPCYVTVLLSGSSTYISDFTHCFLFFYFLRIEKCSEVKEGKMLDCYC